MSFYTEQLAEISIALADPTRREIMDLVLESDRPLSSREVAEHVGLHVNAARMHLDKLVKGGILSVARSRARTGGRPAYLYQGSGEELEIQLPSRRYKLLADILARCVTEQEEALALCGREARASGREEAMRIPSPLACLPEESPLAEVSKAWMEDLIKRGQRARLDEPGDGSACLTFLSCPFGDLAGRYPRLVCEIHRAFEEGRLSLAGDFALREGEGGACRFRLLANRDGGRRR